MKEFLSRNGVSFKELNIAEDERAREDMMRLSGHTAVPTVVADGRVVVGYDEEQLRRLIQ